MADDIVVNVQVIANNDDTYGEFLYEGEYYYSWINRTVVKVSSYLSTGDSKYCGGGLRFQAVNVPQGSIITVAYLEMWLEDADRDDPNLDIYGNDVDDASDFTDDLIYSRTRTSASTSWSADGIGIYDWKQSPSIVDIVKEIVDRVGWIANNDMAFMLIGKVEAEKILDFIQHDDTPTHAAKLHIEYTEAPAGWTGKISGVTNPAKVMGVAVANIAKVKGVA